MNSMMDANRLRLDIEALLTRYPEMQEDEILRADMLEGETDIKKILAEMFRALDDTKTMIEAIGIRMAELSVRRSRFAKRVEFLRDLMLLILQSAQVRKIELPEATLSQRNVAPSLIGEPDPATLPDEFVRTSREPDKRKILAAMQAGETVAGYVLSNAPPVLSINAK